MDNKLKILVVDDTISYRTLLSKLIGEIPDVHLMGVASNGKIAIQKIELSPPDLVFMDVVMPEMDGLEALEIIKAKHPDVGVIMVSGIDKDAAALTVKALERGALDVISKPRAASADAATKELKTKILPLVTLAKAMKNARETRRISDHKPLENRVSGDSRETLSLANPHEIPQEPSLFSPSDIGKKRGIGRIDVVAIGVSTGGPNALKKIIPKISKEFPVPILVVQHMPPMFTASLAENLDQTSAITVVEGKSGVPLEKGVMYIAPGGCHMVVRKGEGRTITLGLVDSPPVHNCRPAVDVLFRSVAMVFGGNVLTVILTGMGNDGAAGVAAIRRKGGYSIVQDEKSSVVWGMPGAVVNAGEADEILPENRIADRIMQVVKNGR